MLVAGFQRREKLSFLKSPKTVVAMDKIGDGPSNVVNRAEVAAVDRLFFQCADESLGDSVGLWLTNEGVACCDSPGAHLSNEVL